MPLQRGRWRPPGEYVVSDGMEDLLPRKSVVDASASVGTNLVPCTG